MAQSVANLRPEVANRIWGLENNPNNLGHETYPGQPPRETIEGHERILKQQQESLDNKVKEYQDICGGGPPPMVAPGTRVKIPQGHRQTADNNKLIKIIMPIVVLVDLLICERFQLLVLL